MAKPIIANKNIKIERKIKMKIKSGDKIIEVLTIKELYEIAVAKGKEDAIIGINYNNTDNAYCPQCDEEVDIDIEYVEEVRPADIEFGGFYPERNLDRLCDCVWLNNHTV